MDGFAALSPEDKATVAKAIDTFTAAYAAKAAQKPAAGSSVPKAKAGPAATTTSTHASNTHASSSHATVLAGQLTLSVQGKLKPAASVASASRPAGTYRTSGSGPDNSFEAFQRLCRDIEAHPAHTDKVRPCPRPKFAMAPTASRVWVE